MKLIALPLLAVVLLAGCSAERTTPAAPAPTVTVTATTPSMSVPAPAPPAAPVTTTPSAPAPEAAGPCTDDNLAVTNGPLESANTQRHVILSFQNTSSHSCTLVGYPGADLVTPAGVC
jgi:PBP1b-binding outer membrane lipoprotein LpoB